MTAGGMTMLSVNDCCLYRIFVFYKIDKWLEFLSSKRYVALTSLLVHLIVIFQSFASFNNGFCCRALIYRYSQLFYQCFV